MRKKLRPYQAYSKVQIYQAWDDGHKNVLLIIATGGGKTVTFASIAIEMATIAMEIQKVKKNRPTVILVHRKELVSQICLTLADEDVSHNIIAPLPVIKGIISAQRRKFNRQFYDYKAPITVVSVDTLNSRILKHKDWAKTIEFWITDEATHLIKNNKWGRAVEYFPNAYGLGVTATPQRLDRRGLGRHADGVFDVMVEGPSTRWLIEEGFLCNYKCAIPESDYRQHLKETKGDSDYSKEAMVEASLKSHIVGDVVENYKRFADKKQAIVFADSIETSKRMEKEFNTAGIVAKLLTGETPDQERFNALMDFQDKKIRVLINVDLFDEGLDVPGIDCVIHARPTKSLSKYLQMNGRGLRPVFAPGFNLETKEGRLESQKAGPKPFLIIIDHVGNIQEHGLPDARRKWTLDRISKRKDKVNLIRICKNYMCNSPYDRLLHECPYCGKEDEPVSRSSGAGMREMLKVVDGDLVLLDPETLRELHALAVLEQPADLAARVPPIAAKEKMRQQRERIETQKILAEKLALWAGQQKRNGYRDRGIHKMFYLHFGMTMSEALGEPTADMLKTIDELKWGWGVE